MVAFCSSVYLLFLAFFLMGIGLNYSFIGAVVSTSAYFEAKRPTAVGLMSAGGGVGTFCIPLLARLLFDRLSYQEAVVFIGAIVLQACVPVMLIRPKAYWKNNEIMLTRSQEQKFCENGQANEAYVSQNKLSTKNANIQLEMDSGNTNHQDSPLACSSSTMAVFTTTPYSSDLLKVSKNSTKIKEPKLKETFLALVSSKPYILYVSACVLTAMGYSSIFILLPLFAKELGIPKYHVSYALSLYGGIEIPARIIHGALANQKFISSLTYLGMVLLIGSVGSLPLLLGETTATLYITCAVYALCLTCFMAFVPLVVLERIEKKYSSVAIGIVYGCEGVSAAIGYIVSPILHSYYSSWKAGIIMIAIAVCSGSLIMLITSCVFPVASTEGCNLNVFTLLKKKESTTSSNIEEDKSHKL
ncbi:monocarboxylate transporter 12-B-like isoform X2 [Watersipora subatra]